MSTSILASKAKEAEKLKQNFRLKLKPQVVGTSSHHLAPLRLVGVSKSYQQQTHASLPLDILKEVDLEIYPGQSLALSGPSGCGKSTLLQIIAGNLLPSDGEVWWGHQRLDILSDDERAQWRLRNLGMMFQDFRLFPHLTALENVALPLELLGSSSYDAQTEAQDLLEQLNLAERITHLPSRLSGGEKQRVALARALITKPMLLLADEPTGNLDQVTAAKVETLLLQQVKTRQVGLVYVTHHLQFAAKADQHWGLHEGYLLQRTN